MPVLKQYNAAAGMWQTVGGMGLPQTPVSFSAHKNGTKQTGITASTEIKITFPTTEYVNGACYDTTTSIFNPKIPGIYVVSAAVRLLTSAQNIRTVLLVRKNGSNVKVSFGTLPIILPPGVQLTSHIYMNGTTDYLEVYVKHENTDSRDIDGASTTTYFQACLIPDSYDSTKHIIDLTSATSDYLLGVGETAKITYTSATSVPLHIATQEGLYEFTISGNLSTTVANDNSISVLPNNTTYSAQFTEVGYKISSGNNSAIVLDASTNQFNTAWSNAVSANLSISTKTTAKTLQGTVLNKRVNGTTEHFTISSFWNDTSTAWTSLGTITFPFAQSGIIVIKRIA